MPRVPDRRRSSYLAVRMTRLALLPLLFTGVAAMAQERPPVMRAMEKRGITVVGPFSSSGGVTAWAAYSGQHPIALYVTPDGKHVIAGTMLDAEGNDTNRVALENAVRKPMTEGVWARLDASRWIADGNRKAPRVVYVFTDPNCPFCNKFWADARPWVDAGKVQLRHVMVGILTPTSAGKAAALLADRDPAAALAAYERAHVSGNAKALQSGQPKPLGDSGLKPLATIPPAVQAHLDANEKLMASLGLSATPAVVWRDAKGGLKLTQGAPEEALPEILGPR